MYNLAMYNVLFANYLAKRMYKSKDRRAVLEQGPLRYKNKEQRQNVSTTMVRDETYKSIVLRPYSFLQNIPRPNAPNGTNAQRVGTIWECTMIITVRDTPQ